MVWKHMVWRRVWWWRVLVWTITTVQALWSKQANFHVASVLCMYMNGTVDVAPQTSYAFDRGGNEPINRSYVRAPPTDTARTAGGAWLNMGLYTASIRIVVFTQMKSRHKTKLCSETFHPAHRTVYSTIQYNTTHTHTTLCTILRFA